MADRQAETTHGTDALALADWRRRVAELYAAVRAETDAVAAHGLWRSTRDELFRSHEQSPLAADDPLRATGLPYFGYDPSLRFEVVLQPAAPQELHAETSDGRLRFDRVGRVVVDEIDVSLDVWWLAQYGGGLFLPVRDGTARDATYGGGRYLLDTVKGSDLGSIGDCMVVDFNFLYHPSCRYSPQWSCPLAPEGNTTAVPLRGGERL